MKTSYKHVGAPPLYEFWKMGSTQVEELLEVTDLISLEDNGAFEDCPLMRVMDADTDAFIGLYCFKHEQRALIYAQMLAGTNKCDVVFWRRTNRAGTEDYAYYVPAGGVRDE